jgi:hypothetical protein
MFLTLHEPEVKSDVHACAGEGGVCAGDREQLRSARQLDAAGRPGRQGQGRSTTHCLYRVMALFLWGYFQK